MAQYICPAVGDCTRADKREIFEHPLGDDHHCPNCNSQLKLVGGTGGGNDSAPPPGRKGKKPPVAVLGAIGTVVIGAAVGGYMLLQGKLAPEAPAPVAAAAPATQPTSELPASSPMPATGGLAPSEDQTQALKRDSQDKLVQGKAEEAEQAGMKATVNEMIKLAIAKMNQGKLDGAEQELLAARAKDAKQPLVYYNMAVLRLRQGRKDDALKELEACFAAGFTFFAEMDGDHDLEALRKDQRFIDLVAKYRASKA